MTVGPAIMKDYDVYYVEFALTFYDLAPNVKELSFRCPTSRAFSSLGVGSPEGCYRGSS